MPKFFYAGTDTEVPESDLRRAVDAGEVEVDASKPVIMRDAGGNRVEMGADQLSTSVGHMLRQGYAPESDELTQETLSRQDAEHSIGQATAEQLAQGVSVGLYGAAAGALAPEYGKRMLQRQEQMGNSAYVAQALGAAVPAFFTGGSSLGARALAATPAGLLARGSAAVGGSLAENLASRGVSAGLARVLGMAAEGTLDGAVSGVLGQLSEDSLGGIDISAERLAASGGLGALFGLATGGGLGAVGAGASGLRKKLTSGVGERIQERLAGEAAQSVESATARAAQDAGGMRFIPDRIKQSWGDDVAAMGKAPDAQSVVDTINDPTVRAEWLRAGEVKDAMNKRLRDSMQKVYDYDLKLRDIGAGELHAENLAETIPTSPRSAVKARAETDAIFQELKAKVQQEGIPELLGKKRYGRITRDLEHFEKKAAKAFEAGEMAEGHIAVANFKRAMWRQYENATRSRPGSGFDLEAEKWVSEFGQDASERARKLLEREDVFGIAGRNQRVRNEAWTKTIETGQQFDEIIGRQTKLKAEGAGTNYLRKKTIVDANKLARQINNIDNPNADFETDIIRRHLENLDNSYSAFRDTGQVPKAELSSFDASHKAIREARQVFDEVSDKVKKFNMLDALDQAEKDKSALIQKVMSPGTLGVVGGFAGGGVGAGIGAAIGGVANAVSAPSSIVKEVTKLEALAGRLKKSQTMTESKVQKAVRRLAMPKDARQKLARSARRAAVAYYGMDAREQRKAAERTEQRIHQYSQDAIRMAEAIAHQTNGMGDAAPKMALAYAQVAGRAAQFLQSKLPVAGTTYKLQPGLNKTQWSEANLAAYSKYMAAIRDPDSVLDDMAAGKLSPESVEAIKAVYPSLYADMQAMALQEIAKHGKEMPFDALVQISLLLDVEGHPLMNPAIQAQHAKVNELEKQQAQPSEGKTPPAGRPLKVAQGYLERIANL